MTNTKMLREKIAESGYKLTYVAAQCGLSYQGFLNKLNNKTQFTAPEISAIKKLLGLTIEECHEIFFVL